MSIPTRLNRPTRFPDTTAFTGRSAPARIEADVFDLEVVEGEIPEWLTGDYFRVQPDPAWPPLLGDDIPLNGDGMIVKLSFEDGHADLRSRYVHTEKFVAERAARRALFGVYRNPYTDDPCVAGLSRGTANTALVWHANRFLALKEDSHPVEVDPDTLETLGSFDFGGELTSPTFTAHPKIDPHTGEMLAFGYEARGETTPDIAFYVIDKSGKITREQYFKAPYAAMVHDFAVTRDFVLFPISPLTSDLERLKHGLPHFAWDSSKQTYLGVLPRDGEASDLRWFRGPASFSSHTMNAWSEGSKIHFDTPTGDIVVFPFFPDLSSAEWDAEAARPVLERWTVDMLSDDDSIRRERVANVSVEFPRIDPRMTTESYRHGWTVGQITGGPGRPGAGIGWNALVHFDLQLNTTVSYQDPHGGLFQEPQFIPRATDCEEGDGVLIAFCVRPDAPDSHMLLFSPRQLDAGPFATIRVPFRLRNGLHGVWIDREERRLGAPGTDLGDGPAGPGRGAHR